MKDYLIDHSGLLDYQVEPTEHLLNVLRKHGTALDGDDMGLGKTYKACALVRELDTPTLVIAPKSGLPKWERVGEEMAGGVSTINYERLVRCKNPYGEWYSDHGHKRWKWNPAIRFLIFDECHRCGGESTGNSKLMIAARHQEMMGLALSATVAENPTRMKALGYFLGLYHGGTVDKLFKTPQGIRMVKRPSMAVSAPFRQWAGKYGCRKDWMGTWGFQGGPEDTRKVNQLLYPEHGCRLTTADVPGFPETQIEAELVDFGCENKIQALYKTMEAEIAVLRAKTAEWNPEDGMLQKLAERQTIDLLKVPSYVSMAHDAVAQGRNVALFVPYRATLKAICSRLKVPHSEILGGQTPTERQKQIDLFQFDKSRICVIINQAGGESIDLHDVRGEFPRLALITPPYEAWLLRQIVGRVRRAGGKSKSLQRILCARGTYEETVYKNLVKKSLNMDALNDGDLDPLKYKLN